MQPTIRSGRHPRRGERGATLIVAIIAVVALLGIGMATMLAVRSDTVASGGDRFQQIAMYAAESGVSAGIDYLRTKCAVDGTFFTAELNTSPSGIVGNNVAPGATGNPFTTSAMPGSYYSVRIENNAETVMTADADGVVILRSVGYGPNQAQITLEVQVQSPACISAYCGGRYTQKGSGASNDNSAMCPGHITASSLRSATP